MPFGTKHDEIVVIETPSGRHAHRVDHNPDGVAAAAAVNNLAVASITITDDQGEHTYPRGHIYAVRLQRALNYTATRVDLWQDQYGIGRPGEPGAARLYLVDPEQPDTAWPIKLPLLKAGFPNFRTTAARLVEDQSRLQDVTDKPVPVETLAAAGRIATWHHGTGTVTLAMENRAGVPMPVAVAGPVASDFLDDDRNGA